LREETLGAPDVPLDAVTALKAAP